MARRPHMGLRVQRDACLWALGIDPNDVDFHHDPILAARPIDPETGDTIPPANFPQHITPMLRADHKARTPADIKTVGKVDRLVRKRREGAWKWIDERLGNPPLCGDCPPVGYETDRTRCRSCPRRKRALKPKPPSRWAKGRKIAKRVKR